MPKTLLLITIIAIILALSPQQSIAQKNTPPLTYPLTAMSDDTTVNYAVTIVAHHRFAYTIKTTPYSFTIETKKDHREWPVTYLKTPPVIG